MKAIEAMDDANAMVEPANSGIVSALLRPIGAMLVLLVGYFVLPIGRESDWHVVGLVAGAGLLTVFCVWEIWHFARSKTPARTAIEMLAAVICFYIVVFSTTYFVLSDYARDAFTEHLSRMDALYFCLTVFTTTGFGDISAASGPARVAVSIQMASTLVLLGLGIRFVNLLVQERLSGRHPIVHRFDDK